MIVLLDNYDSFTYNLVQCIGELETGMPLKVIRNDVKSPEAVAEDEKPTHLIISPGPCSPDQAGLSMDFVRFFHGKIPIMGVCLGHQSIAQVFGAKVIRAPRLMHGKVSEIRHDGKGLFVGMDNPFTATRYHSLIVDPEGLSDEFEQTAWSQDQDELMGIRCKTAPTEGGHTMLRNFLQQ